ncbi:MAG: N-acetylornithine carbamoyltransferase [Planctomycetota bacterium]|jgi:N-acetylornithine carbamoyltransferase
MQSATAPRHLIRLSDLPLQELDLILERARSLKLRPSPGEFTGQTVGLLFFRGSLRTRISLEVAMHQLGGNTIELTAMSDFWDLEDREGAVMDGRAPEHIKDAAAVLSRYVDALAVRTAPIGRSWELDRRDETISSWARHATVPVINMESALWHPLQALADRMTLKDELGQTEGKRVAVIWVHSPQPATAAVTHSLLDMTLRDKMNVSVAHPPGYELDAGVLGELNNLAEANGCEFKTGLTQEEAVKGADIVYARSWQSLETYGNPTLSASRRSRTTDWKVDRKLLDQGNAARFMHAMPVRRNIEVSDEVLDSEQSLVYTQAENRLHAQKALLLHLLKK